jgi:hypothetical protein
MASRLAWLDHSEAQRQRMMEIVGMFRERNTIDDLGLGSVRDTFSDALFPGTSTLHTRTKYLLFVPWIFQSLEDRNGKSSRDVEGQLQTKEVQLSLALQAGGETDGVIGRMAGKSLKQFPSTTYWGALGRYGIRRLPLTRQQVIGRIRSSAVRASQRDALRSEAEEYTEHRDWHPNLPPPKDDFLETANFALDEAQGAYLEDRILQTTADSALAFLVRHHVDISGAESVWDVAAFDDAPTSVRSLVAAAEAFSHLMQGAQLLYHLLVARQVSASSGAASTHVEPDAFEASFLGWCDVRVERGPDALADPTRFWELLLGANPRLDTGVRSFVGVWLDLTTAGDPKRLSHDPAAAQLIGLRERTMKGSLARLSNRSRLDTFSAAPETGRLGFRWGSAKTVIEDLAAARGARDA